MSLIYNLRYWFTFNWFINTALKMELSIYARFKISDIHKIYYGLAVPLKKKRNYNSHDAIAHIERYLSGKCPKCGHHAGGETLTTVGTLQEEDSKKMVFTDMSNDIACLVSGKCPNAKCDSTEIVLDWG